MSRAYETALAIARPHGVDVARDPRWREFAFGRWEGLTWSEIVERYPALAAGDATAPRSYAPDGGESFEAVTQRVRDALDTLRGGEHEHALVVAHAGPLHAALHVLFGAGAIDVRFVPASITRVMVDRTGAALLTLNDSSHL